MRLARLAIGAGIVVSLLWALFGWLGLEADRAAYPKAHAMLREAITEPEVEDRFHEATRKAATGWSPRYSERIGQYRLRIENGLGCAAGLLVLLLALASRSRLAHGSVPMRRMALSCAGPLLIVFLFVALVGREAVRHALGTPWWLAMPPSSFFDRYGMTLLAYQLAAAAALAFTAAALGRFEAGVPRSDVWRKLLGAIVVACVVGPFVLLASFGPHGLLALHGRSDIAGTPVSYQVQPYVVSAALLLALFAWDAARVVHARFARWPGP